MSLLPETAAGHALEIASSTGAHIEVFAPAFPSLTWHPSEYVPPTPASAEEQWPKYGKVGQRVVENDELLSIDAHGSAVFSNVVPAVALDLMQPYEQWPASIRDLEGQFTLVVLSNTLHITPWECSSACSTARRTLSPGGKLVVYGPFKVDRKFVGADGGQRRKVRRGYPVDERELGDSRRRRPQGRRRSNSPYRARWTCRPTTSRSRSSNSDVNLLALTPLPWLGF